MEILYKAVVINNDSELKEKYMNHNVNYMKDVGLDVFTPVKTVVPANAISFKIGAGIKANAYTNKKSSYMIFPRSSMGGKTPLRLTNSIGLVDPDYTGELCIIVDNVSNKDYVVEKFDRLVQLVGPNHEQPKIELVDSLETTMRDTKGIGSSGR